MKHDTESFILILILFVVCVILPWYIVLNELSKYLPIIGNNMKLFLISQIFNNDYDTFDSAVVVAANEEEAKLIKPGDRYTWCAPEHVEVAYIGEAKEGLEPGTIVCASFNAG